MPNRNISSILFMLFFSILNSCKPQTDNEKISVTARQVIDALKKEDAQKFIDLIGFKDLGDISKNKEMVIGDVTTYGGMLHKYFGDSVPNFEITELYNFLGQKLVRVPLIRQQNDSCTKEMHLDLLFGPPNIVPLSKISKYYLISDNEDSAQFRPIAYWKMRRQQ